MLPRRRFQAADLVAESGTASRKRPGGVRKGTSRDAQAHRERPDGKYQHSLIRIVHRYLRGVSRTTDAEPGASATSVRARFRSSYGETDGQQGDAGSALSRSAGRSAASSGATRVARYGAGWSTATAKNGRRAQSLAARRPVPQARPWSSSRSPRRRRHRSRERARVFARSSGVKPARRRRTKDRRQGAKARRGPPGRSRKTAKKACRSAGSPL